MKIRTLNRRGRALGPVFAIVGRPAPYSHGAPPVALSAFGKTLYSPKHHIDAEGRPIPARCRRTGNGDKLKGVYTPATKPTTEVPLDAVPLFKNGVFSGISDGS